MRRTLCSIWTGSGSAAGRSRSSSLRATARVSVTWSERSRVFGAIVTEPSCVLSAGADEDQGSGFATQLTIRGLRSAQTLTQPRQTQVTQPVLRPAPQTIPEP